MTTTSEADMEERSSILDWLGEDLELDQIEDLPKTNEAFASFLKATALITDNFVNMLRQEGGYTCTNISWKYSL